MRLLAPKTKQSYLFLAPLQWPWQGCCWNLPRECNAVRRSCVPPPPYRHYRHYRHSPPRPFATVRFDPLAWSSGSDQRRISGCGIRWLLAGPDSLPLWLCYLHFTTDYTCMIVYVTNNKEPWTLECVLTQCISVWYGNSSNQDCKALQRVVRLAERISGSALPSLQDIFILLHILLFISLFYLYICSCVVLLLYNFFLIILHCPLSGPDLIYISLLIIPCIIYYVTNKQYLNLEP